MSSERNDLAGPDRSDDLDELEPVFGALLNLAYRMLGTRSEAEDAVQDTFLRWQEADRTAIRNKTAWLTTTCTRRCIDLLRRAERDRLTYVGAWLPEPVYAPAMPNEDWAIPLASSLSTAFLLMLERLPPKERAAYLLHDIFELPYPRIAETLGLGDAACRKLVSRARLSIRESRVRAEAPPPARQEALFSAFRHAIETGDAVELADMLAEDIEIRHDSGGKVSAAIHVLQGKQRVVAFVRDFLHRVWSKYGWRVVDLNGARAILLEKDCVIVTAVTVGFDANGVVTNIYILRNPDKLASLSTPPVLTWVGRLE